VRPSGKRLSKSIKWNSFRNFVVLLAASTGYVIRLASLLDCIATQVPVFLSPSVFSCGETCCLVIG
jgi:hypothetical protein